jgi:hypothetical protein
VTGTATRLLFLGAGGMPWHGVDKLRLLAEAKPDWTIDIIGLQRSEISSNVPPNMNFHGTLLKSEYQPLLDSAAVGIGTLALHRKSMDEACALKTREYLAHGLPVVLGYKDTDFSGKEDFICQIENTEDNIRNNIGKIVAFVDKWRNKRVPSQCVEHLKAEMKEIQRLKFFEHIASHNA